MPFILIINCVSFIFWVCVIQCTVLAVDLNIPNQQLIDYINNNDSLPWKAVELNEAVVSRDRLNCADKIGFELDQMDRSIPVKLHTNARIDLPDSFDAREKWSSCSTIGYIYDQGGCGSSWALGTVQVISDRICIQSNESQVVQISAADLLSCCAECGEGCMGGQVSKSLEFWITEGLCTGGEYNDLSQCFPYPYPRCSHTNSSIYAKCHTQTMLPVCSKECQSFSKRNYIDDKHFGKKHYRVNSNETDIMIELFINGPVTAWMYLYSDFLLYKEGIYKHVGTERLGSQVVKIIGWGTENDLPYWLCVHSWNFDWGDSGMFKILRGSNECFIEHFICGGTPKLENKTTTTNNNNNNKRN